MYAVKNKQTAKEEALSAPKKGKAVRKINQSWRWCPHCCHYCNGISSLYCDGQALPQVEKRLGIPGDLFEMATQFSQEREAEGMALKFYQ